MLFKLIKDAFNTKKEIKNLEKRGEELKKESDRLIKQANEDLNDSKIIFSQNSASCLITMFNDL